MFKGTIDTIVKGYKINDFLCKIHKDDN